MAEIETPVVPLLRTRKVVADGSQPGSRHERSGRQNAAPSLSRSGSGPPRCRPCYGTLGVVALLSVIGVAVPLNEELLVRIVTVVLTIALLGMVYSFRMHRDIKPLLLGIASAALLFWAFYGQYSRPLEALGFAGLVSASLWDFRAKHRACPAKPAACSENRS